RTPVVDIGGPDYNDLILSDESVSTSHAKLQRREGVWVLVDLESTNGTFVDGERITADTPLAPGGLVRFGDVQLVFEPTDDAMGVAKGGGTKTMEAFRMPPPAPAKPAPAAAAPAAPPPAKPAPAPAKPAAAPAPRSPPSKRAPAAPAPAAAKKGKGCGGSAGVLLLAGSFV